MKIKKTFLESLNVEYAKTSQEIINLLLEYKNIAVKTYTNDIDHFVEDFYNSYESEFTNLFICVDNLDNVNDDVKKISLIIKV